MSRLVLELIKTGVAAARDIMGCTEQEIHEIEAVYGRPLPATYEVFLGKIGRRAGLLFCGTDIFYPDILDLRANAEELLGENDGSEGIPTDALVFAMHQGYQLLYFPDRSADPPVMWYYEGRAVSQMADHFTSFLEQQVREHGELVRQGILPVKR